MARSGKSTQSSVSSFKKKTFETVIYPNENKVKVCPDFFKAYYKKIKKQDYGWIMDKLGRNVRITFGRNENENYILAGRTICSELLIQKPTAVKLKYMGKWNRFEMEILAKKVSRIGLVDVKDEVISDGELSDGELSDGKLSYEDDYDPDKLLWTKEVTRAIVRRKKPQVMHFPNIVSKNFIPDDLKEMILRDIDTLKCYKCRLITSNRSLNEKYLGKNWYKFVRARKLRKGDVLIFSYFEYPFVLSVEVVRRSNQ